MTAHHFRVGQLVSAADPATLADLCPTYTRRSTHAIVVAVDEHQAAVKWIDYRGIQHETCVLEPSLLRAGTLNAAARTRVIHCRRTDTALPGGTPAALPGSAEPTIEIRELRIFSARSSDTGTGLKFHTVHDANVALHALADAQEAFQSTFGPDPASAYPAPTSWSSTGRYTRRCTASITSAPPPSPQHGRITEQRRLHSFAIPSSLPQHRSQRHRAFAPRP